MRMLIVGAGSTGGYFGGRLTQSGRDVTFLVRPAREKNLRENGLCLVSPHGDAVLTPRLITADRIAAPFDVVLLTVKAFSLSAALEDMAPAVGPDTMILPVLNGMKHVDMLAARFGRKAVIGGACKIATVIDEDGRIVQLAGIQDFAYGEMDGAVSPRIEQLDRFMRDAGFDARLSPSIEREMWEKWVLLAALGGVNCLMRGSVGDIAAAPGGTVFVERFLNEVGAVVASAGHPMNEMFIASALRLLTTPGSDQTSSMYRDLTKGQPIEADQIIGDLVDRGRQAGIQTPLLEAAYTHLLVYQNRIADG